MTFTLNGIGTQTYGKLNRLERADHCDHCQTLGTLQSYDTTKYFVILFVPLIPLGKLRILDHCQRCNRWRQVNLKKWQHDKEAALRSALDGLKRNHQDADAVRTALATATQFQDQTLLLKLKSLVDTMTHDHETQILYASASIYFGNPQEAITPLKHAIAAHDTRETREHLAATLLEIGDSQQAEQYVDYVWKEPDPTHLPMCRAIAEAYQQSNDHAAAIDGATESATRRD